MGGPSGSGVHKRSSLPYGAVMATGGASALAGTGSLHPLALPLLWLTIAEAASIPVLRIWAAWRSHRRVRTIRPSTRPERRFGEFTVPVGLAVIGAGLAGLRSLAAHDAAMGVVVLAWLATLVLVVDVVAPVTVRRPRLAGVDGTWFLAPAALLADAIGTVTVSLRLPGPTRTDLGWLALVGCDLGVAAYTIVLGLATVRVCRKSLGGPHRAPWWISAGCAGLAAAAVGQVSRVAPVNIPSAVAAAPGFAATAVTLWIAASVLLVPVVALSVAYLTGWRRPEGSPPWPPTFSTAVYALGAIQAGRLGHLHFVGTVGVDAGLATVALWLVTAALYAALAGRWVRHAGAGGLARAARQ